MKLKYHINIFIFVCVTFISCKKFIDPGTPETGLIKQTVFENDATANGAVLGIYFTMLTSGFAQDYSGISAVTGLYTDELRSYTTGTSNREVYTNSLTPISSYTRTIWQNIYSSVYQVNSVIEAVSLSTSISPEVHDRLLSESYFLRAFLFFNLVNLYGEVPVVLSTDYEKTRLQSRSSVDEVYAQIFNDLDSAESMASDNYVGGDGNASNERIRVNKSVIEAFTARVLLYRKDYENAEAYASRVIDRNDMFILEEDLMKSFLATSREAIWQLKPSPDPNTMEAYNFIIPGAPTTGVQKSSALSASLISIFSSSDKRLNDWIGDSVVNGTAYYHAFKYKSSFEDPKEPEYLMVLRLSELLLIRAEARAEQGKLTGANSAVTDLAVIRNRAGLIDPITITSHEDILDLIEAERRRELFTEWGHRFFDLKRWKGKTDPASSRIDEVMPAVSLAKGGAWEPYEKLFPVPQTERTMSPNLSQNNGYN